MRRIAAATVVSLLALAPMVRAEETTKRALAEQLLNAMEVQKTIENSFEMVKQMIPVQMKKMGVSDGATSDTAQSRMQSTMDLIMQEMSWERLKDDYIAIYAETFTEEELKGALAFYKTPVGRKFIEKQPELMRTSMEISQRQMATLLPKIQQLTREMMDQKTPQPTN